MEEKLMEYEEYLVKEINRLQDLKIYWAQKNEKETDKFYMADAVQTALQLARIKFKGVFECQQ